jgi:hypothetical protein
MIIQEDDFKAEQLSDDSIFWDLNLLRTKKKRDGTIVDELGDTIYGLPLDSVMKRIVANRIARNNKDKAITMKQYLDEWKQEMVKLSNLSLSDK